MATRPLALSIPIAGRMALRPRVTGAGEVHSTPSSDLATNTAEGLEPGDSQSCRDTQIRPAESTSADGSGNARKLGTRQEPSTSAMRTGATQVVPPSAEREVAIAGLRSSQ